MQGPGRKYKRAGSSLGRLRVFKLNEKPNQGKTVDRIQRKGLGRAGAAVT